MPSSDSSSSSSEDRKRKKKHKKDRKKEKKQHKKDKKKRKDKKRRRDDDDDAPVVAANVPKEKLDAEDDYYARAAEFRTWLRDAKDLYLDDIGADEARRLFAQFVERWNAGRRVAPVRAGRPDADPPIRQATGRRGEAVPAPGEASRRRRRAAASEGAAAAAGRVRSNLFCDSKSPGLCGGS